MLKPGDTVVVPRIDRLARNLTEGLKTIEELHGQGINIRSLTEGLDTGDDSPTSHLMLHMLLSLAEWERETIRDRIRAGVDRAASERRTGGRSPALSAEKVEAVRAFLENGGSVSAAARTFGASRPTVRAVRDGIYALSRWSGQPFAFAPTYQGNDDSEFEKYCKAEFHPKSGDISLGCCFRLERKIWRKRPVCVTR